MKARTARISNKCYHWLSCLIEPAITSSPSAAVCSLAQTDQKDQPQGGRRRAREGCGGLPLHAEGHVAANGQRSLRVLRVLPSLRRSGARSAPSRLRLRARSTTHHRLLVATALSICAHFSVAGRELMLADRCLHATHSECSARGRPCAAATTGQGAHFESVVDGQPDVVVADEVHAPSCVPAGSSRQEVRAV